MERDQSSYFCRSPDDFCWGPAPAGPTLVTGLRFRPRVLELVSFLNNDRWTVQFGVGYKTKNEMCNVHVHNVMFIEFILF